MLRKVSLPSLLREGKKTAVLAVPLIIGQVSHMLLMIADTIMVGKVGITELAALTFANAFFSVPFVFGIGLITSISVLTSTASGADDDTKVRSVCRNGFYLALGAGIILALVGLACIPFLSVFGQPPAVTAITPPYLSLILISLIPGLGSIALKNHSDSLGQTWTGFYIFLVGVLLNIILNQLFIFELGYGLVGAGWATLISRCFMVIAMIIWFRRSKSLSSFTPNRWIAKPDRTTFRNLFALGIPASFHLLSEVGAFSCAGFLVGHFGKIPLAAHQIALTTAGTLFMIPLGIAIALTMRMGNAAGAQEAGRYPAIIYSGWLLSLILIFFSSSLCGFFGKEIAQLYVSEKEVILLASQFLIVVAIFQLFDGIQVISGGILRGLEDVTLPAWVAFISYIVIGLPVGFILARHTELGSTGIWWGLAIGLAIAAVVLSLRVLKVAR